MSNKIHFHYLQKTNVILTDKILKIIAYYKRYKTRIYKPPSDENVIPLQLFTCWHDENMPKYMKDNIIHLIRHNPDIKICLYHEKQCQKYMETHFEEKIVHAYNKLVPHSYKSDLWRFCVLYREGGIYMDIKYSCESSFHLNELCKEEHFVLERPDYWEEDGYGMYTALLCVKPNNSIMKKCIEAIVQNIEQENYGWNALYPTGPGLLGQIYFQEKTHKHSRLTRHETNNHIYLENRLILKEYEHYRDDLDSYQHNLHYSYLWRLNAIYQQTFQEIQTISMTPAKEALKTVACIYHIGNYHTFLKMKPYLKNVLQYHGELYHLHLYVNCISSLQTSQIQEIKSFFPQSMITVSPNYGFDMASFFYFLHFIKIHKYKYDYVLKLHTKTNDKIRNQLLHGLIDNKKSLETVLQLFEKREDVGLIGTKSGYCNDAKEDYVRNIHYLHRLTNWYFKEETLHKIPYISGTMFFMKFSLLEQTFFKAYLPNIYNSFNSINTFDYNWYFHTHRKHLDSNVPFKQELLYAHYLLEGKKRGWSKNLIHALHNKENKSFLLRDAMIEHAYERFFAYIVELHEHKLVAV